MKNSTLIFLGGVALGSLVALALTSDMAKPIQDQISNVTKKVKDSAPDIANDVVVKAKGVIDSIKERVGSRDSALDIDEIDFEDALGEIDLTDEDDPAPDFGEDKPSEE